MVAESKQIRYKFYYRRHWLRESYVNWNCVCCVHYTPFGYCFLFGKLVTEAVFFEFSTVHQLTGWNFKTTQTFWARQNLHIFIVDLFVLVHPSFCFILLLLFFSRIFWRCWTREKSLKRAIRRVRIHNSTIHQIFYVHVKWTTAQSKTTTKKKKEKEEHTNYNNKYKKTISSDKKGALWFGFL